jgi:hypothetical protein
MFDFEKLLTDCLLRVIDKNFQTLRIGGKYINHWDGPLGI